MKRWLVAIALALAAGPVVAQQELGYYMATLGPRDMVNSRGERLRDFCQILQQDRANYHRFGLRDELDMGDPFFASAEARQVISQLCVVRPEYDYIRRNVLNGIPQYVWVQVIGTGGRITAIIVNEGAG
jgi:hypothetical protein